jgi:hypothetical protein
MMLCWLIRISLSQIYIANFSTLDDYFRQLGKLDYIVDKLPKDTGLVATIDLTLGRSPGGFEQDVPVSFSPMPGAEVAVLADPKAGAQGSAKKPSATPSRPAPGTKHEQALGPKTAPRSEKAVYKLPPTSPRKSKREF